MAERLNIIAEAEQIASSFAEQEFKKNFDKLYKEQHRQGCGCASCAYHAVNEVNSWVDYFSGNPKSENLHFHVVNTPKGIEIIQGPNSVDKQGK